MGRYVPRLIRSRYDLLDQEPQQLALGWDRASPDGAGPASRPTEHLVQRWQLWLGADGAQAIQFSFSRLQVSLALVPEQFIAGFVDGVVNQECRRSGESALGLFDNAL